MLPNKRTIVPITYDLQKEVSRKILRVTYFLANLLLQHNNSSQQKATGSYMLVYQNWTVTSLREHQECHELCNTHHLVVVSTDVAPASFSSRQRLTRTVGHVEGWTCLCPVPWCHGAGRLCHAGLQQSFEHFSMAECLNTVVFFFLSVKFTL